MRKPLLSRGTAVFSAVLLMCLLTATVSSREGGRASPSSVVHDWSAHHVIYPRFGPMMAMLKAEQDPRAIFAWQRLLSAPDRGRFGPHPPEPKFGTDAEVDWSINLGPTVGTPKAMYPAKFSFDPTAAPSCANDYIVYPVGTAGSATQSNIVAFNHLYSGTAGGTGVCNRTAAHDDNGTAATVLWSYNVEGIAGGGAVPTSPVIAYDERGGPITGETIAFVESATGNPAHFHVLAPHDGDGQDTTDADGLQNTLKPATIDTFVSQAPAAGSGTATDLPLGASTLGTDTLSSPYVDYTNDVAYVGNDIGVLYRIKDVFCVSFNPDCQGSPKPAPSLDTTWGSGGSVTVCSGVLSAPVLDVVTGNVFVGCSDGKLYGLNSSGTPLSPASVTVGDGTPLGGIVDGPIVDGADGLVYAVSGTNGTHPVLVQTRTNFATFDGEATNVNVATLGRPEEDLHLPTPNNAYFNSMTTADWVMYVCAYNSNGAVHTDLYNIGFTLAADGTREMKTGTPPGSNISSLATAMAECSPLTEFFNPNEGATGTDWLFIGRNLPAPGNIRSYNVSAVTSTGFPGGFAFDVSVAEEGGTSGQAIDNESTDLQASSVYFSTLMSHACGVGGTGFCAVKLTQSGLH